MLWPCPSKATVTRPPDSGDEIAILPPAQTMAGNFFCMKTTQRWKVQQYDPFKGWNDWVIYDEEIHANDECKRRISEANHINKKNWRVIPENED